MERRAKIALVIILLVFFLLAWAPWMDGKAIHDQVLAEKGRMDGTIDKDGNLICDYNVMWFPFGRYVASCEGGWLVMFWGKII